MVDSNKIISWLGLALTSSGAFDTYEDVECFVDALLDICEEDDAHSDANSNADNDEQIVSLDPDVHESPLETTHICTANRTASRTPSLNVELDNGKANPS